VTMNFAERRVRVPGAELHLAEAGSGDPVVLLHGWPQHGGMWRHLAPELARSYRVLIPDLRGFGRSDAPPGPYDKHTLLGDVLALLDAEGIERAIFIGHDWGGWVSWLAALEHPERVERLIGIDIPPPSVSRPSLRRLPKQLVFSSYQVMISAPGVGAWLVRSGKLPGGVLRAGSGKAMRWTDEELEMYLAPLREPARARATVALYRTFLTREVPKLARGAYTQSELKLPALSIFGEESKVLAMTGLPDPDPNLRVEVLPATGHFVPEERPEEVAELVRGFLG